MSVAMGAMTAAAIANAVKASGVVVSVRPEDFSAILRRTERPLVITSEGGVFSTSYKYLMSYKGLAFYTKSRAPLALPADAEVVRAQGISVPQL